MNRDQLEAAIWHAFRHLHAPFTNPAKCMDEILQAADAYARHEGGLTAQRRADLADAVSASYRTHRTERS